MAGKIKWALGASIVLNLFLLAAMGGSAYVVKQHCKSKPLKKQPSSLPRQALSRKFPPRANP